MVCTTITVAPTLDVTNISVTPGGTLGYVATITASGTGTRTLHLTVNGTEVGTQSITAGTWTWNLALSVGSHSVCATVT